MGNQQCASRVFDKDGKLAKGDDIVDYELLAIEAKLPKDLIKMLKSAPYCEKNFYFDGES